jgi:hypothetical protein
VREWLKDRRNALIDAILIYAVTEWIAPPAVSAVVYLGLSASGQATLFMIAYALLLVGVAVKVIRTESSAEDPQGPSMADAKSEEGRLIFVRGYRPMPYMLGGYGRWIRVPARY